MLETMVRQLMAGGILDAGFVWCYGGLRDEYRLYDETKQPGSRTHFFRHAEDAAAYFLRLTQPIQTMWGPS